MTTSTLHVQVDPAHTAALHGLTSIADRVRYACQHGPGPRTDEVRQWLAAYGYETKRPYVSTLVTGYRASRGMEDTGDLPPLTEEVLAALDRSKADDAITESSAVLTVSSPVPTVQTDSVSTPSEPVTTEASNYADAEIRTSLVPDVPAHVRQAETHPVSTESDPVTRTKARRPLRPVVGAALLLSSVMTVAGVVTATNIESATASAWSLPTQLSVVAAVVTTLVILVWSATSVATALAAGRTARDVALDVASWVVAGIACFLAAIGQIAFARWAGITDWTAYLVPGILEPSVVVLLLLANRRVQRAVAGLPAKPIGKLLTLAALLGGFAVYTNVVHAPRGPGLVFGAATVIGLILWWVKLQDTAGAELIQDAPHSKRISRRTARYRLMRWLILPTQTTRAWLISLDHSVDDAEIGLDLARRWRRDYDDCRATKVGRRLARRTASRQVERHLAEIVSQRG